MHSIDDFELLLCQGLDSLTCQLVLTGLRLINQGEFEQAKGLFMRHSNEPLGQYLLGYVFSKEPCEANLTKAFEWFLKSAKADCPLAFFNVGLCYSVGLGVKQDANEAVSWYRKGAELGDSYAQFNLGQMLARRVEVPRDYIEAYKWFFISKFLGNDSSERWVVELINKISKDEYDDANFEIEEWVANKFEVSSELDHPDFRRLARSEKMDYPCQLLKCHKNLSLCVMLLLLLQQMLFYLLVQPLSHKSKLLHQIYSHIAIGFFSVSCVLP
jgi:hypothetical protein